MATIPELLAPAEPQALDRSSQPSVLADAVRQTVDRGRSDFVSVLESVAKVNPDTFAKATEVQRLSGIPAETLYKHSEQMQKLLQGNKYASLYDSYGRTANALRNGHLATLAQDDIDNLSRVEQAAQVTRFNEQSLGEKLVNTFKQSLLTTSQGAGITYADRLQRLSGQFDRIDQEIARAAAAGEQPFADGNSPIGFGFDYLQSTPEERVAMRERVLSRQSETLTEMAAEQQQLEDLPTEPGALRAQELGGGLAGTAEAIAENPAYAARTSLGAVVSSAEMLVAGAFGGPLAAGAVGFGGESNVKLLDVLQEAGVDMTSPKAVMAALQDDALMADARTRAARKAAGTTLVDVATMGLAGKVLAPLQVGGRTLSTTQRELANLGLQFPVQGIGEGLGEAVGQFAAEGEVDAGEVLLEAVAGAGMSSVDVGVFGGRRIWNNISEGLAKSRQARQTQAALGEMVDSSLNSKLRGRDLQAYQSLTEQQLKGSEVESIWIPAAQLSQLNQSGADLVNIMANIPGLTEQFAEAEARGGSVTMKTSEYLAYFADYHEQLASSVRMQPEGMSIEDATAWQDQQEAEIEAFAEEMLREPDDRDQAFINMMGELQQAGYRRADAEQYAATHLSAMTTLSDRTGKPLAELLARFPLDIRAKAPEQLQRIPVDDMRLAIQRLRAGDVPRPADMFGKSLGEYLRDAGGVDDTGGELAALDTDSGRAGRNRIIRQGGKSLDDMAMQAWERGYFPGVAREDVGPQLVVDAMRAELAGSPRYSAEQENATLRDQAVNLEQLEAYLGRLDVDLAAMTDDEVLAILRDPDAIEGQQLNQAVLTDDQQRLVDMTEDEYIAAVNPTGKRTDESDIVIVREGDLFLPSGSELIESVQDRAGQPLDVYADAEGSLYAVQNDEVVGQIENRDGETLNIVTVEAQGKGVGSALASALIRRDPFAPAGSFSPAGEAARRSAFRKVKAELQQRMLNQSAPGASAAEFSAEIEAAHPGLKLGLLGKGDKITLSRITLPKEGQRQGVGSEVMSKIAQWADQNGKTVSLSPSADFGGNKARLTEFYKRFGFVENKGRNRDFEISEAMYRVPAGKTMQQGGEQAGPRGSITFTTGPRRSFQISLTAKRDLSTLLHELGHYYLEIMSDLAADVGAPQQIRDDIAAIRKWTGASETGPFEDEQHEQFARGFERYLSEGKAPNPELQGAFARFKRWMLAIYKDLTRLNVELSDEIRGVFDRLVATGEQIADAERIVQAMPMFESAAKAGMNEAEFAAYRAQIEASADEARTTVEQQVIQEEERRHSKWWREQEAKVRQEVAEEVDTMPEYAAMKALRSGVMPDGTTTTIKLQSGEINERYGRPVQSKLMLMHAKTGGVPMDIIAPLLGYQSGDEMIKAMLGAVPRAALIAQETEQRMLERHGPKSTGESAERAMDAVHNEKRAAVLIRELNALGKQGNRNNITSQQVLKQAAERIMQQRRVRDIQPFEYQRAEGKAGRLAFSAAAKGDLEAAYEHKQQQLLNFYLWREARKARESIDTMVDRLAGYNKQSKREKLGKAGHDYLDQIDAVMEQYEFRNVSLRQLDKRKSFGAWYAEQVAAGNDPFVPEFVLNTQGRVNYKDLSLEQLTELDEFVANINHLAGLKNKLQANKRIADRKEAQDALAASAFANMDKLPTAHIVKNSRSLPEVARDWLRRGNSSLMKMEQVIEWLDGGNANGAWSTIFYQPLAEAQHKRDDWNKAITMRVVALTNEWMTARGSKMGEMFQVRGIPTPMTTTGMLAAALNSGNASNRDKLLRGYGWDESTLQEILGHMTQADWQFVVKMWKTVESLWPAIVELEKKVSGVAPPKIEGLKVQTPWGEVQGGYWPLVYDSLSPKYADVQKSLGSLAPLGEGGTVRATPARGHTQARVDSFAAPIILDVGVIGNHLNQVIHDLTHRVALADAHSLIKGEVREAMNQTIGPDMAAQFVNILDGIASDQATGNDKAVSAFAQVMNALRVNQAIAWMGYSVTTVLNQQGGYAQALDYFAQKGGRKYLYRAMVKYWGAPIENQQMIREMSGEMRNRAMNLDASIREASATVTRMKDGRFVQDAFKGMQNGRDVMVKYAFVPVQVSQSLVDSVVWMGAYEMEGGTLNHEDAVQAADRAVRLTQTAGGAKDLAAIQQNVMAKLFMPVYGYASLLWNRNVDISRSAGKAVRERNATGVLVAFERFCYLNMLPAILTGMIRGALPDDDDDDETWAGYMSTQAVLGVASGIPLAGAVAQGFLGEHGYGGASAIGQGFDSLIRATSANQEQTITTNALSAIGAFTGIPSAQLNRAVKTAFMVENGEMDDSADAIIRGVLFGPEKK